MKLNSEIKHRYSLNFKEMVCKDFLSGSNTKTEIEKKYNVGHGRVLYWLIELGYTQRENSILEVVKTTKKTSQSNENEIVSELKKELEDVKLQLEYHKIMIEVAERELKINIRKKYNTK